MSETPEPILLIERDGPVAILTLNRARQLNALSVALRSEIVTAVRDLSASDDVRAIVLTGKGRAFTVGVDLKEAGQSGFSLGTEGGPGGPTDLAAAFVACPWPIIGAINGFAITGGFELALMCDVLLASTEAKFADTHGRVGLMPVWGLSQKLPRIIGASRAKELSLTGNFLDAETAERWGLVNRVYAPEALLPAARKLALEMASLDGALLKKLKAVMDDGMSLPLADALKLEIERGNVHNRAVTPGAAEESRKQVMERGREQSS
ncbi:MAG: enoyl-CoA hydratase [Alphaproteobacteria bacterium]|nr:enoyl-CoA hydratase [Alphaproteobacteria bacterium]